MTRIPSGTPCVRCRRPMRAAGTTATDNPGTVRHRKHGLCDTCTQTAARDAPPKPTLERMRDDTRAYLRSRGRTGNDVPAEVAA